jgi:hypothetical protein
MRPVVCAGHLDDHFDGRIRLRILEDPVHRIVGPAMKPSRDIVTCQITFPIDLPPFGTSTSTMVLLVSSHPFDKAAARSSPSERSLTS